MNTIATWLASLGLEQYVPVFESEGVDLESLPFLTEHDLTDLGVLLGHRKRLLRAIGQRSAEKTASGSFAEGERRQLTVLFCDLVGSTELAHSMDSEDLRDLMHAYQRACWRVATRYTGHVAQYLGDGLVVYFGYPHACEDAAERAVRAALDMVSAVRDLHATRPPRVHIGVATGAVVVGGACAADPTAYGFAIGTTPNLAARLCSLAAPDQIVIAPRTHRLLGQVFEFDDGGEHELKGIGTPVHVWRVRGLARTQSRFSAARPGRHTPFVGREREIGLLLARWRSAREGKGQSVLISGEAGIGKSRMAHEIRRRLAGQRHLTWMYQCSPYHTNTGFYPVVEQISKACGFESRDGPDEKLDKLEATLVSEPAERGEIASLFAALLALPAARYGPRSDSPQRLRELTIDALSTQAMRRADARPLLIICEDVQWVDAETLGAITLLIDRITCARVLLLITCRSDCIPSWTRRPDMMHVALSRLARADAALMTGELSAASRLPPAVIEQVLDRADGIPLFVEELTRAVLEAEPVVAHPGARPDAPGAFASPAVPYTLHDSLMSRLDRLASGKEVAQIGACIGVEFDRKLLAVIASVDAARLEASLRTLEESELISARGSNDDVTYRFSHALVGDVAYESLLRSRRLLIHARIARALAEDFPERARLHPELLALHLARAGMIERALPQWLIAARTAIFRNRHHEALGHVHAAFALAEQERYTPPADDEVALLLSAFVCHSMLDGFSCAQAMKVLARIEDRLASVTQPGLVIQARAGIAISAYSAGHARKALAVAEQLISLGEGTENAEARMFAFVSLGPILHQQGQFTRCITLMQALLDICERVPRAWHGSVHDAKAGAYNWLAICFLSTGRLDQARRYARLAVDTAEAVPQPFVLSQTLSLAALPFIEAGDFEEAGALCRRSIELCDTQRLPYWKGWAIAYDGVALQRRGMHAAAEQALTWAIRHLSEHGNVGNLPFVHAARAQSLAHLGRIAEARRDIAVARAHCLSGGELIWLVHLDYARGVVEQLDPDTPADAVAHWFDVARCNAREHNHRLIELRATVSLATLLCAENRRAEARALLAPVLDGFEEGRDTAPVAAAREVIRRLDEADGVRRE